MFKMNRYFKSMSEIPIFLLLFPLLISLFKPSIEAADANGSRIIHVGVIVNVDSPTGEQQKLAMDIAAQNFNNHTKSDQVILNFHNSGSNPFQAGSSAEEFIRHKKVKVIIGMETWQEASLVADLGNKAKVPVISLTAPPTAQPLMHLRWPFLIQMAKTQTAHMKCIADIVGAYKWRRVIAIYEDDPYSGDFGTIGLLSEALQKVDSKIEYSLPLPPFDSLSDPKGFVLEQMLNLATQAQSRVFVVLHGSLPMVAHLFKEAKRVGLMGRESVWIVNEGIATMLDSVNSSVLTSMEGTIGIKTHHDTASSIYHKFLKNFQIKHDRMLNSTPGIYTLRAYDSVSIVTRAIERLTSNNISSDMLLREMLSSNFSGLSGNIRFLEGELSYNPLLRIVNVVEMGFKELDFWMDGFGFFKSLESVKNKGDISKSLSGEVVWPGELRSANPKGWLIHSEKNPLRVSVSVDPAFANFVKIESSGEYTGLCIDLFLKIRELLSDTYYGLPYEFIPFDGSYDNQLFHLVNKTYDAIVGDVTILANRLRDVEFTQPYTESRLSLIVPAVPEGSAWLFIKPFSWQMWMATGGILFYTMFIVWLLEHRSNPEFSGPWKAQISTTLTFAFSSLFFAHKENIYTNFARVVVVVWLIFVFVITSSYTASLSSMLTVQRMKPVRDVAWLKRNKLPVGCDNRSSFVRKYLEEVYNFLPTNIINVESEEDYLQKFRSREIAALFLELPYQKVFLNKYCKEYVGTTAEYRLGGLSFAFQKGSPMARDFSEAILSLTEDGTLKKLEDEWLTPSRKCLTNSTDVETDQSLTINNFWGLYIISASTSTICLVLSTLRNYRHQESSRRGNVNPGAKNTWKRAVQLSRQLRNGSVNVLDRIPTFTGMQDMRNASRWETLRISMTQPNKTPPIPL